MSERKNVFFTSDWHIGHQNVLAFDNRPFTGLDHMHTVLVNNYNASVSEDDICYFLGDMGLGSSQVLRDVIARLNGTKVLILGNHDKQHNSMYNCGFDVVLNSATLYIAGERVTLSHCPLRGVFREDVSEMKNAVLTENWHGESRHGPYSVTNEGQFHLHGHIHSGPANEKERIDGRQYDIGAPGNKYRPVSMSTIESWISKSKI
jgi:calcineurin-like phosphoesterase family protein